MYGIEIFLRRESEETDKQENHCKDQPSEGSGDPDVEESFLGVNRRADSNHGAHGAEWIQEYWGKWNEIWQSGLYPMKFGGKIMSKLMEGEYCEQPQRIWQAYREVI